MPTPIAKFYPEIKINDIKFSVAVEGDIDNLDQIMMTLGLTSSTSIGDVIAQLYLQQGISGFLKLTGTATILLYDSKTFTSILHRLLLSHLPLYFVHQGGHFSASTNPLNLLQRSDMKLEIDPLQIMLLYALKLNELKTSVFAGLDSIGQGEMIVVTPDRLIRKSQVLSNLISPFEYASESHAITSYRILLEQIVDDNLMPDQQYGIMLSSGIDSSSIAALAAKKLQQQQSTLHAYSWVFPNNIMSDESIKIQQLCEYLNIPLTTFNGESFGPFSTYANPSLVPDTPFINPFSKITEECYRRASDDNIQVLFNGNFADLLFPSSRTLLTDVLQKKKFLEFLQLLWSIIAKQGIKNIRYSPAIRGLVAAWLPKRDSCKQNLGVWLTEDAKAQIKIYFDKVGDINQEFGKYETLLSPFQINSLGMDRYLSGRYNIQRIEPHRNLQLVNYLLGVPTYWSYKQGIAKYFVREALRGLIPETVRVQPRVGCLHAFLENDLNMHIDKIKALLFDHKNIWNPFVAEKWMMSKLNNHNNNKFGYDEMLVIWISLTMVAWLDAIKPGGALFQDVEV